MNIEDIKKEYKEKFDPLWKEYELEKYDGTKQTGTLSVTEDVWNFIETKLIEQREEARKEETERWINQPANEHDNRIRKEAVEGFANFLAIRNIAVPSIMHLANQYISQLTSTESDALDTHFKGTTPADLEDILPTSTERNEE